MYETALQTECAYNGTIPYWDWTLDSSDPAKSPIWSATAGFGGNGLNGGFVNPARPGPLTMCVQDGPFRRFEPAYSTGQYDPHCLNRGFNNNGPGALGRMGGDAYTPAIVANITTTSTTFPAFATRLEDGPHGAVHASVGGDMVPSTSPNGKPAHLPHIHLTSHNLLDTHTADVSARPPVTDPIFFLHHAQIDRLWWNWQQAAPTTRNAMYGGNRYPSGSSAKAAKASLTDVMPMAGLAGDLAVREVMTTESGLLCYRY